MFVIILDVKNEELVPNGPYGRGRVLEDPRGHNYPGHGR